MKYTQNNLNRHEFFMQQALQQAKLAWQLNEVPIGAVIVQEEEIIATGHNLSITNLDPTAHAEIIAIRNAARILGNYRLVKASLYITVEPCIMCFGALMQARIKQVVFGVKDPKFGAIGSVVDLTGYNWTHKLTVTSGVLETDCKFILQEFFKNKRK